ncbi:MAG: hypothetical protein IJW05_11625 [Lentisphaeria bacterium]|nr:hypothetical protein [Lentisphaeria bacterium]
MSARRKIIFIVCTLLFLIIAGFRSINLRALFVIPPEALPIEQLEKVINSREGKNFIWAPVFENARGMDLLFLQTNVGIFEVRDEGENYKKLYESDPENLLYCTNYALYLSGKNSPEFQSVAEQWKKLDPDNALPCFLIALKEFRSGIKEELQNNNFVFHISDQNAVNRGLQEYQKGLQKQYASAHVYRNIMKKRQLANLKCDPLGEIQRVSLDASCIQLSLLNAERLLARYLAFLAEKCASDGKKTDAETLLRSGEQYLRLRLKEENPPFINILVYVAISRVWADTVQKTGFSAQIPSYDQICANHLHWKTQPVPGQDLLERHGGFYIQQLVPALRKEIAKEDLKPERMTAYLIADEFGMAALYLQMLVLLMLLALISLIFYLRKRAPRWIELPRNSYLKLLLIGIILPVAVFLIWTHFDVLSGRDLNFANNKMLLSLTAKYLVFFMPLFFGVLACVELVKKAKAKPVDCIWNLIFLFSMFLAVSSLILRPALDLKIRYYTKNDPLIHTEKAYCELENKAVAEYAAKLNRILGETK